LDLAASLRCVSGRYFCASAGLVPCAISAGARPSKIERATCKSPSLLFVAVGVSVPTTRLGVLGMWANLDPTRWEKPALISNLAEISGYISVTGRRKLRAFSRLNTLAGYGIQCV
jgi:hypothetical protein